MHASIVIDLGFGDAGKGTTVDYLTRRSTGAVIVRFNGGAQAAHNVHTTDGTHHTFSQFGSGTLVPGTRTFLSRHVLFDPFALDNEAQALVQHGIRDPLSLVTVDGAALTVTPFQKAANRVRESLRGQGRHGSVGMGIGETMADMLTFPELAVYARDLRDPALLALKLARQQELKQAEFGERLAIVADSGVLPDEVRLLSDPRAPLAIARRIVELARRFTLGSMSTLRRLSYECELIFEGAQGILIDEWHGFHPYTTWSTTTNKNANSLLSELNYAGPVSRYGVVRAYSTRHGPGPFPSEDVGLTLSLPDTHNVHGRWQGGFRVGWLDIPLTRYALSVSEGTDSVALTHLDRFVQVPRRRVVVAYEVERSSLSIQEMAAIVTTKVTAPKEGRVYIGSFKKKSVLEDLGYQEMLGGILAKSVPVFEYTDLTGEAYADFVSDRLGVPVGLTSYGRTAAEKRLRLSLRQAA
jgi:adenylosuccinate synthase